MEARALYWRVLRVSSTSSYVEYQFDESYYGIRAYDDQDSSPEQKLRISVRNDHCHLYQLVQ